MEDAVSCRAVHDRLRDHPDGHQPFYASSPRTVADGRRRRGDEPRNTGTEFTVLRWDGLSLADVGAAPRGRSLARMALGFLVGLLLVMMQMGLVTLGGHLEWVRSSGVGVAPSLSALAAYLALACREELAFHGYPLAPDGTGLRSLGAQIFVAAIFYDRTRRWSTRGRRQCRRGLPVPFSSEWRRWRPAGWRFPSGCMRRGTSVSGYLARRRCQDCGRRWSQPDTRRPPDRNEMVAYLAVVGPAAAFLVDEPL